MSRASAAWRVKQGKKPGGVVYDCANCCLCGGLRHRQAVFLCRAPGYGADAGRTGDGSLWTGEPKHGGSRAVPGRRRRGGAKVRRPCAGPGAGAGRRHAPPGCFCTGAVFLHLLSGCSGDFAGGPVVSDSGYLYPGCRSALGGAKHPEAGSRRRFAFFGGPGRRGNLQRLEKGLPG